MNILQHRDGEKFYNRSQATKIFFSKLIFTRKMIFLVNFAEQLDPSPPRGLHFPKKFYCLLALLSQEGKVATISKLNYNKMMFLDSDQVYYCLLIYKCTNITTKLNWKLFTKVIKRPSKESLGLDRQIVLIKREAQALLI